MGIKCEHTVPYKAPKGYRREFHFFDPGNGFHERIIVDGRGITLKTVGGEKITPEQNSRCLDWIAESICMVRAEIEGHGL